MAENDANQQRKRKRPRAARACERCRAKKYRCDEADPCGHCTKKGLMCVYKDAEQLRERLTGSLENSTTKSNSENHRPSNDISKQDLERLNRPMNETNSSSTINAAKEVHHAKDMDAENREDPLQVSDEELNDVNQHTQSREFYGSTSSLAFLASIGSPPQGAHVPRRSDAAEPSSLISAFHNSSFSPESSKQDQAETELLRAYRYHFRQAQAFLPAYFQNLHYIHPIIDKQRFLNRCEDLWFRGEDAQPRSFIALYYSLLSLAAINREWDEDRAEDLGRFGWSRKFFRYASAALAMPRAAQDLDTIQALILMAKVCQNELNPNLAYMYLGMAVRASLSAGFNRQPRSAATQTNPQSSTISRTWWGLYSLEIEMSFSLGRPDSLGNDEYHNRVAPDLDGSETAIIPAMIDFAKIIRKVSQSMYLTKSSLDEKLATAASLTEQMDNWVASLPTQVRLQLPLRLPMQSWTRGPQWTHRQKLVLHLRYLNVSMVMHRPFLLYAARNPFVARTALGTAVLKCFQAAKDTIELMHQMYESHPFFRSWFYNTTYTLYAVSIVICYMTKIAQGSEKGYLDRLIEMSIEILETMEDSDVAKRAAQLVRRASDQLLSTAEQQSSIMDQPSTRSGQIDQPLNVAEYAPLPFDLQFQTWDKDFNLDFIDMLQPFDDQDFFMTNNTYF